MLLAISGVTGVGKTYYKNLISEKLGYKKVHTIRTRKKRINEKNNEEGYFLSKEELDNLEKENKIAYRVKLFEGEYAYLKDEIFSSDNMVFEMHYTMIDDFKKIKKDMKTIYLLPDDINKAIENLKKRNMETTKQEYRINELMEQYNKFTKDKNLRKKFDYILLNNYDKNSEEEILSIAKEVMLKKDK